LPIKSIINNTIKILSFTKIGRFVESALLDRAMKRSLFASHNGCDMEFATPNPLTRWRATTFASKEPETLRWIDGMSATDVFWDIGANVGLYSIYAAKRHGLQVFSFEPSVFNLELLARNCALNKVISTVTIIPIALSDETKVNRMQHTTTAWGGALSSFGANFGSNGEQFDGHFEYSILGISADELIKKKLLPPPTYMKIDVDGIEHYILKGAGNVTRNVKSVLVEVNEGFPEQHKLVTEVLKKSGLKLVAKHTSPYTEPSQNAEVYNQIWERTNEN